MSREHLLVIVDLSGAQWSNLTHRLSSSSSSSSSSSKVSKLDGLASSKRESNGMRGTPLDPQKNSLENVAEQLIAFLNAFLLLNTSNLVSVIAALPTKSRFLFPSASKPLSSTLKIDASLSFVTNSLAKEMVAALGESKEQRDAGSVNSNVAAALSLGLCYINRASREQNMMRSRILILQVSDDVPNHYVQFMNCIFSAQKQGIPVDVLLLRADDSLLLVQAAHLTKGIYTRVVDCATLLQHLLTLYLADSTSRAMLRLPYPETVDYRATCFCHRKIIDMGFVCPVCLSIFCSERKTCSTCGAEFPHVKDKEPIEIE